MELRTHLSMIWSQVLKLDPQHTLVDADDFFALGGWSLLALAVANRVGQELNVDISPTSLIEHQTLGAFAEHVARAVSSRGDSLEEGLL